MFAILYRHHWVNLLWPSDTIWQQRSGSTLAQVLACCLSAPSHYLNQCWLIISEIQWHSWLRTISQEIPQPSIARIILKIIYLKFHLNLPMANGFTCPDDRMVPHSSPSLHELQPLFPRNKTNLPNSRVSPENITMYHMMIQPLWCWPRNIWVMQFNSVYMD